MNPPKYDSLLLLSFGGPESRNDVIPFLENVLRGRNVPRERLEEVAHHYYLFDGVSPLNQQNRDLIAALEAEFQENQIELPIYWGNRNWHPYVTDALRQMHDDGKHHPLVLFTAAYGGYSSCRQYLEDIDRAVEETGIKDMQFSKLRAFFNHPGFIALQKEALHPALEQIPQERRAQAHVAFTAHSVPTSMAGAGSYLPQLQEVAHLVAEAAGLNAWQLVFQSRSGPPHQPWLEPDICDHLETLHSQGVTDVIIAPIGFLSDHMEVIYDLDTEAQNTAQALGLNVIRAATPGTRPRFITMLRETIVERLNGGEDRAVIGSMPPAPDTCPADCCVIQRHPSHVARPKP